MKPLLPSGRFETLPEDSRTGAVQLIRDLLTERQQAAPQLPAPAPARVANAAPVPRQVQTMSMPDLQAGMTGADQAAATRISRQYFDDNNFNDNHPVSLATNALRNYDLGPHQGADVMVRELAARQLEQMYTTARLDAEQIAETLKEIFYEDEENAQAALNRVEGDINMLRNNNENAWEDLIGPMAEDIPWSPTVQSQLIEQLEAVVDFYREQRDNGYAKGGRVKKPAINLRKISGNPELVKTAYKYGGYVV
jgi:hypothetical protein